MPQVDISGGAHEPRPSDVDWLASDSGIRLGLVALAQVIRDRKATPAQRYTAERGLVLAVEHVVASHR